MPGEHLTLVFELSALDSAVVVERIAGILHEAGIPAGGFKLYGTPMSLSEASRKLAKDGRPSFLLNGQGIEIHLSRITNHKVDVLEIRVEAQPPKPWEVFVTAFLDKNLVMAWVADSEYEFWQNAEDLQHYRTHGKSFDHLPRRSNGLPPPLEQSVVDISENPGRRTLRIGYCEAIGSVMWLGKDFCRLSKVRREDLEAADWLRVRHLAYGVLEVTAERECFRSAEGASGATQRRLRAALYPTKGT